MRDKPYIVWVHNGYSEWSPTYCTDEQEIMKAISEAYGRTYLVTKIVDCAMSSFGRDLSITLV